MRSNKTWFAVLILCAAVGWAPASAFAEDDPPADGADEPAAEAPSFEELARQGSQAFADKDYAAAIEAFEAAYEVRQVPNLLYNIARTYERKGDFDEAVTYYERFVNQPEVDLKARRDALERIKTLREVLALREEGEEVDREEVAREGSEPELAETPVDRADPEADPEPAPEPARAAPPSPSYALAYTFAGLGVASLGAGGVFGTLAAGSLSEADGAATLSERRRAIDSAHTQAAVADGLFVGGALLSAVGLYFAISPPDAQASSDVRSASTRPRLEPRVGPGGASMTFTLDF
jgi:tetratricopeptide (TPR) repeat protein